MSCSHQHQSVPELFDGRFPSILLFGPPGAGKGTVGRNLSAVGEAFHLSSGDIFRGLSRQSPAGKLYHQYAMQGLLVPDEVTIEIFRNYVSGLIATNRYDPQRQYLLLDGIPRTLRQSQLLDEVIAVKRAVVLDVLDESTLIQRIQKRAKIENRSDDLDDSVLRKRLAVYRDQTEAVLSHYPEAIISRFQADQRPPEVLRDVLIELAVILSSPIDFCSSKKSD